MASKAGSQCGPYRLDNLPLEIIDQIVSMGPCQNAIALSQVNKKFNVICKDPLIFTRMVKNGNGRSVSVSTKWWRLSGLDVERDSMRCAKWALADSKAGEAVSQSGLLKLCDTMSLSWLASLLLLGHPVKSNVTYNSFNEASLEGNVDPDLFQRAAFYFAYSLLQFYTTARFRDMSPVEIHDYLVTETSKFYERLNSLAGIKPMMETSDALKAGLPEVTDINQHQEWLKVHVHATIVVGLFSNSLIKAQHGNRLRGRRVPRHTVNLEPPKVSDLLFSSWVKVDDPFCQRPDSTFVEKYVESMVCRDFLEGGEWVGYYCYSFGYQAPIYDTMMEGIEFQAVAVDNNLKLKASGRDSCGTFNLEGSISMMTGLVDIDKKYNDYQGNKWHWFGPMTPFGIVGTWGSSRYGGWFWLWKRSWSTE